MALNIANEHQISDTQIRGDVLVLAFLHSLITAGDVLGCDRKISRSTIGKIVSVMVDEDKKRNKHYL